MDNISYRFSNKQDKDAIIRLWKSCFNVLNEPDFLENYENGRYLVCMHYNELIGMASLYPETMYTYELTWVGVLPEYRGMGIATELIRRLVILSGNCRITTEAWKTGLNGDRAHLDSALRESGFKLEIPDGVTHIKPLTCQSYKQCAQRGYCKDTKGCSCDIYVRDGAGMGSDVRLFHMEDGKIYLNKDSEVEKGIYLEFVGDGMMLKNITKSNVKYLPDVINTLKKVITDVYMEVHSSITLPEEVRGAILVQGKHRKFKCNVWCDVEYCNYSMDESMECYFDLYRI